MGVTMFILNENSKQVKEAKKAFLSVVDENTQIPKRTKFILPSLQMTNCLVCALRRSNI